MKRYNLIIAVVLLTSSIVLLFGKLFSPQPIQIVLETGQEVTTQAPNYYGLSEVLLLITASFIMGATAIYLFYNSEQITSFANQKNDKINKEKYRHITNLLKGDERKVFDILMNEDNILQNKLVLKTGLSKVSITRALRKLEMKNLVVKERHGLTNKIKLNGE